MSYRISAPGTGSRGPPTPVVLSIRYVLVTRTNPGKKLSRVRLVVPGEFADSACSTVVYPCNTVVPDGAVTLGVKLAVAPRGTAVATKPPPETRVGGSGPAPSGSPPPGDPPGPTGAGSPEWSLAFA